MTDAIRDSNFVTVALGQSDSDATVTLPFKIDSVTGRLLTDAGGSGGNPGGMDGEVQWNDAGSFAGIDNETAGYVLTSNGAGVVPSFQAFSGSPGGSDTQLQYNDGGVFGGIGGATAGYLLTGNGALLPPTFEPNTSINALSAIGSSPNANGATITGNTLNLEPASSSFGGVLTTGTQTIAGAKTFNGALTTLSGVSFNGAGAFQNNNAGMQLLSSSNIYYTVGVTTGTTSTLATGIASARFIIGTGTVGTFTSGTHPIITSLAVKPMTITNNGATVTNTATTYIESAMSGGTNNYALWVDAGEVRIDGDIGDTTNRVAKVWSVNAEFTNAPTLGGTAATGSGGLVRATSPTITTATLSGTQLLSEGASIGLDPSLSADGTYTGTTITGTAGYTQAFGDLVYLDPTDSRWEQVDANSAQGADGDARATIAMVVVPGTDGNACTLLLNGAIRADAKFPTFTVNNTIYASETAGAVTQTQPSTSGVVIRVVGYALTADSMIFNPSPDYITHT